MKFVLTNICNLIYKRNNILFFFILFSLAFITSCRKSDETLGLESQLQNDRINFEVCDTSLVIAKTIREDKIRTDETSLNLLGSYIDPIFGYSEAGFFTQFRLPSNNIDFKTNLSLDSLVLSLDYSGYFGDTLTNQIVEVYRITDNIYTDSSYYSNDAINYNPQNLATLSFAPRPKTKVKIKSVLEEAHLRIKLDASLGNELLNASASGSNQMTSQEVFQQFFKGLYVKVTPVNNNGSILYFNLTSSLSKLTLYYQQDTTDLNFDFVINDQCARINKYNHNYTGTIINDILNSEQNDKLYLEGMSGVKVKLSFPNIMNWVKENKIAINKAELIIKTDNSLTSEELADRLFVFGINEDLTNKLIADHLEDETYHGGFYDKNNKVYIFRINKYIQDILNGNETNNGLYLIVSGAAVSAKKAIIYGNNSSEQIKLKLTYTRL